MLTAIAIAAALGFLLLASIADLKTGEIPEKLSFGLIAFTVLVASAQSLASWDAQPVTQSLLWGLIAFAISYALFYYGQWGGGDVKIMAGVGCLIGYLESNGYSWPNNTFIGYKIPPLLTYFIDVAFASTPYVIVYTIALGLMHPAVFRRYLDNLGSRKSMLALSLTLMPLFLALHFDFMTLAMVYSLVPLLLIASIYLKTVEDDILTRTVEVSELRDWDIMADDVIVDGEKIASKRDIEGITPDQRQTLLELSEAGKIPPTLKIKWGVKFVPILFIALALTLYVGNLLELVFNALTKVH
ncbi:MAG: hypothetical protein GF416_05520 [Candidatus Altiarchaeales archaeon]|nr:hypothetical protein [Candidatus Altiarchaeales archaeon]MBD3416577.1 hypothetical protein [Candidatus Altiarchaeales archaeon]